MLNPKIKKIENSYGPNMYEFQNRKGERVVVEITHTKCNPKDKNSMPNLWLKYGYIQKPIYNYLNCKTYVYNKNNCRSDYNPTIYKTNHKINFKWVLANTKANEEKIVNEVYKLANK